MSGNSWKIIVPVLIVILAGCMVHQSRSYGQPAWDTQPAQEGVGSERPRESPPPQVIQLQSDRPLFDKILGVLGLAVSVGVLVVLAITLQKVGKYTQETRTLAERASDQSRLQRDALKFDAITRIHQQLASHQSMRNRLFLHRSFRHIFKDALKRLEKDTDNRPIQGREWAPACAKYDSPDEMTKHILVAVPTDPAALNDLVDILKDKVGDGISALEAVEGTLTDFTLMGVLVWQNVEGALEVARGSYEHILRRTGPIIQMFVALQRMLRGDERYAKHYTWLLQKLDIPVPERLRVKSPEGKAQV